MYSRLQVTTDNGLQVSYSPPICSYDAALRLYVPGLKIVTQLVKISPVG